MTYLKSAIATLMFLLVVLMGYIAMTFNPEDYLSQAYHSYLTGDYDRSLMFLEKADNQITLEEKLVYQAYIARNQGYLKLSQKNLLDAEKQLGQQFSPMSLEIVVNQAFNGYLENDSIQMKDALGKTAYWGDSRWKTFFHILADNLQGSEGKQELVNCSTTTACSLNEPISLWMQRECQKVFTPFWEKTYLIRKFINESDYLAARQLIEDELHQENEKNGDSLNLLMGLSYMKEANLKPEGLSGPYYKLAFSYYDRLPFHQKQFQRERQEFFNILLEKATSQIKIENYEDLEFYLTTLEKLEEEKEIKQLSKSLLQALTEKLEANQFQKASQLVALLNRILPDGNARKNLDDLIDHQLQLAVSSGDMSEIQKYRNLSLILTKDLNKTKESLQKMVREKIISNLKEKHFPEQSQLLAKLWKEIDVETKKNSFLSFAEELVTIGSELIPIPQSSDAAFNAFYIAQCLVDMKQRHIIDHQIKDHLKFFYAASLKSKDVDLLIAINGITKKIYIQNFSLFSDDDQKKQLKEAHYFLANRLYDEAGKLADWILVLSPHNCEAQNISGLVSYYQGKYSKASNLLNHVGLTSQENLEACAVSNILSGNSQVGLPLIKQIENNPLSTNPEIYLRLGFGELIKEQPEEATYWFDKIGNHNEAFVGAIVIAFQLHQWNKVMELMQNLDVHYRSLTVVESIKIQTLIHLQKFDEAKKGLDTLLSRDDKNVTTELSSPFKHFIDEMAAYYSPQATMQFFETFAAELLH